MSSGGGANIPTFIAELPPSPRSNRQRVEQETEAKRAADDTSAKLNEGLRAASMNAPIPSMILQESAEEDQLAGNPGVHINQRRNAPVSAGRTSDAAVLASGSHVASTGSADVKPALTASASTTSAAVVQVMLQLPGTNIQLPVNIPAESILPVLTKCLSTTTSTGVGGVNLSSDVQRIRPLPSMTVTGTSVQQSSVALPSYAGSSRSAVVRPADTEPRPTKVARLSSSDGAVPSPDVRAVSQSQDNALAAAASRPSSAQCSDNDEDGKPQIANNRTAATRCRQKKKMQVEKMEQKAKDLQDQNQQLEMEMQDLRQDIAKLESLLKEHSACFLPPGTVHAASATDST